MSSERRTTVDGVTPRRRARPADSDRRREILAAATEVFAEKGIAAATVRDIGDRSGILSGSLYHHFSSKEEMIAEILVPVVRAQLEAFDTIVADTDDPSEIVRGLISAAVSQTAANPHAARILRNDFAHIAELPGCEEVTRLTQAVIARWASAVRDGIAAGRFRPDTDPDIATAAIVQVVLGAYRHVKPFGAASPEQISEQLCALILDGLNSP